MLAVHHSFLVLLLLLAVETLEARRHRKLSVQKKNNAENSCATGCVCHSRQAFCNSVGFRILLRDFPKDIETIHFRDNYVRKIKYIHLTELYKLKHLVMKGNQVSYIEPNAFSDLGNLVSLSLTENNLRFLAPDTFSSQSRLQVLSLRKNKLKSVEKLFWPLESLRLLNLGDNRIQSISRTTLKKTFQLRILDLHANRIKSIHKNAFKNLPFLRFLVLRDNPLKAIELNFRQNFHLELLDLTNCQLTEVVKGMPYSVNDLRMSENRIHTIHHNDFKTTRKVRMMVLNNNHIHSIHPHAFDKLWQLYALYIGANRLKTLPSNLPKGIGAVYANHNNITHIGPDDVSYRPNLQTLLLKHNQIGHIDQKAFRGLYKLTNLDLKGNDIHVLNSMVFSDTSDLEKLDLSGNPLRKLEKNCFVGLSNLNILQMSSVNSSSTIQPSVFKDTPRLAYLDLSNSSGLAQLITSNLYAWSYIQSVQDLNLMGDQLSSLSAKFPNHFPHLKMIKLVGNPWHCDHKLLWLRDWMNGRTVEFFAPHQMTCETPATLKGRLIKDLTEYEVNIASLKEPIINLLNITKYANRYHKAFLGKDGKWYLFNTALSSKKGYQTFSAKRLGKLLSRSGNNTLTRKPRPPGAFVVVKETLKDKSLRKHRAGHGKGHGKGHGRGRGREVAALHARVPEPVTARVGPRATPTWGPAPQPPTPPTGTSTLRDNNGRGDSNVETGEEQETETTSNTAQETKIRTHLKAHPPESVQTLHGGATEDDESGDEHTDAEASEGLSADGEAPEDEEDTEDSQESTGGSPFDKDSSGFVSGDDFLIV